MLNHLFKRLNETASQLAEDNIDPYEETPKYARAAVYFLCTGIFVFGLANVVGRLSAGRKCECWF